MFVVDSISPTELFVESDSAENKYKGLLNANFQDYMDGLSLSGQLEIKSSKLKKRISSLFSASGMALGTFGGPAGLSLGFAVGNTIGKYIGNVVGDRIYGQAISDMAEIVGTAKLRHAQIASSLMFQKQMTSAVDTFRQNENKRVKDAIQEMQV